MNYSPSSPDVVGPSAHLRNNVKPKFDKITPFKITSPINKSQISGIHMNNIHIREDSSLRDMDNLLDNLDSHNNSTIVN